jgi:hypothetical protein
LYSNKYDKLVVLSSKTKSATLQRFVIRGTSMLNMIYHKKSLKGSKIVFKGLNTVLKSDLISLHGIKIPSDNIGNCFG